MQTSPSSVSPLATVSDPSLFYVGCTGNNMFVPHPWDCSRFIKCAKSEEGEIIEIEEKCPSGLLFNSNYIVCDCKC